MNPQLDHPASATPLWKRLAWMAAIWLGSVIALGVVAAIIRYWLRA